MLELIQKIKTYTEAGIILEHMELFDEFKIEDAMKCIDCKYFEHRWSDRGYCGLIKNYVVPDIFFCAHFKREA